MLFFSFSRSFAVDMYTQPKRTRCFIGVHYTSCGSGAADQRGEGRGRGAGRPHQRHEKRLREVSPRPQHVHPEGLGKGS